MKGNRLCSSCVHTTVCKYESQLLQAESKLKDMCNIGDTPAISINVECNYYWESIPPPKPVPPPLVYR